jgi:hypothetical protein
MTDDEKLAKLEELRRDESEPDIRRLLAATLVAQHRNRPSSRAAVAADLGWPISRLETAIAAAVERGWMKLPQRRV